MLFFMLAFVFFIMFVMIQLFGFQFKVHVLCSVFRGFNSTTKFEGRRTDFLLLNQEDCRTLGFGGRGERFFPVSGVVTVVILHTNHTMPVGDVFMMCS